MRNNIQNEFDKSHQWPTKKCIKNETVGRERKENYTVNCDEKLLFKVVKLSFQQRRKTLRNSLKTLGIPENIREGSIFDLRPEKLSGQSFVELTKRISDDQL